MLASIHPLGERARGNQWSITTAFYAGGSVVGGGVAGIAAGAAGRVLRTISRDAGIGWRQPGIAIAAGCVLVLAALSDAAGGWRLPSPRRQVDDRWMVAFRGWVYGAGFGFQLGLGVATIVTTAAVYAWLGLTMLTASPFAGLIIGATFGATRALPIGLARRASSAGALRALHRRMAGFATRARWLAVGVLGLAGIAATVAGIGGYLGTPLGMRWPG